MKKRLLSVFLALALCMGLCAVPAFAASNFMIEDGHLYGYNGPGGDIVIPNGVTVIEIGVFYGRTDLTSVTIPNGVTDIGPEAFRECSNLANVSIPSSVTWISSTTFDGTPWLEKQGDFAVANGILLAYQGASGAVTIPGGVTMIADGAFDGRADLTNVTIPDGVTTIDGSAFRNCTALTSITIPSSTTQIWAFAFEGCTALKDVYYGGTEAQWNIIEEVYGPLASATIHYNSSISTATPVFTDVPDWCSAAVDWAVDNGVTTGTTANKFAPSTQCSQAMILTFLWRAAKEPASTAALPVDIGKNISYAETALRWAAEKGMVGQTLDPTAPCTRAEAVTYLWQAFGSQSAAASSFSDVPASASYAAAVNWAVANGIVEGYPDGAFHPDVACNRAVIVTMLHRAYVGSARLS